MAILKVRHLLRLTSTDVTSITHGRPTVLDNITHRGRRGPKAVHVEVWHGSRIQASGSSFVLDCANDRREYGAASASGDHL
jgi:hypothetical protein